MPVTVGSRKQDSVEIAAGAQADWKILVSGVFPIASQAFLEKE